MQELKFEQVEDVNGGFLDEIGAAEDALVLGGAALRVISMGTPIGLGLAAITVAYYGGKAIGSAIAGD